MNLDIENLQVVSIYEKHEKIDFSKNIFLNGISPYHLEFLKSKDFNKEIFVSGHFNRKIIEENWPWSINCINLYQEKNSSTFIDREFDFFVFEGETNFFSGIDIATKILKELDPKGEKTYYIPHFVVGRNSSTQYTTDFQEHIHSSPLVWEDFYRAQTDWLPSEHILDEVEAIEKLSGRCLIVSPSISYHQPIYNWSLNSIRKGSHIFASKRSAFTSLSEEEFFFPSQYIFNYSPFSNTSRINILVISQLIDLLRSKYNV
ncbi:MAG: hypothetical protein CME65_11430 [Halobacteriovoraceae bacterium]|nr:hypothetical protein [Halobacteriovoraceae bacterium]|tara:strand:- start:13592 stop:14371 length:780 start_codon:yes stop_codon:yes gene_type:complete